ncbi:42339_t:CDS:2, partial [Gigaspora margarita]
ATIQRAEKNPNLHQEILNPCRDDEHVLIQVTPNLRSDNEHISILIRGEDNQQDNPDPHRQEIPNSRQETPTSNSYNDQ